MAEHDGKQELTRELLEARIEASLVEFRTELKAMAKALALAEQYPTAIDEAFNRLRELHDQRFAWVEKLVDERFAWMEKLLEEQRHAEKEARDKAEDNIGEQLKQVERTHESRDETTHTMLGALKERVTAIESARQGAKEGASSTWGYVVGFLGVLIAALAVGSRSPW